MNVLFSHLLIRVRFLVRLGVVLLDVENHSLVHIVERAREDFRVHLCARRNMAKNSLGQRKIRIQIEYENTEGKSNRRSRSSAAVGTDFFLLR